MKRENHKRCDTMGFCADGTGKLEIRFRLLIFNIFSLRRTFQSILLHPVLSCVIKTCTLHWNLEKHVSVLFKLFNRQRFFNYVYTSLHSSQRDKKHHVYYKRQNSESRLCFLRANKYSQLSRKRPPLVHDDVVACARWSLMGRINKINPKLNQ